MIDSIVDRWNSRRRGRKLRLGPSHHRLLNVVLSGFAFIVLVTGALILRFPPGQRSSLVVGDVSPSDVRAPHQRTFISGILTEQARVAAEEAVEDVYDSPEKRVARQQVGRAEDVLAFVESVRHDPYAPLEEKSSYLKAIAEPSLGDLVIDDMLTMSDRDWGQVVGEVLRVLDLVMRGEIRETWLEDRRRTVSGLVSLTLDESQTDVVVAMVRGLIRPNSFYNAEQSSELRRQAREGVSAISRSIEAGEVVLRAGDLVDALDVEALEVLGLQQAELDWMEVLQAAAFVLVLTLIFWLYLCETCPSLWNSSFKSMFLVVSLWMMSGLGRVMVPGQPVIAYMYPLAGLSAILTSFLGLQAGVAGTLLLTLIAAYLSLGSVDLLVFLLATGLIGALSVHRVFRLNTYLRMGAYVAAAGIVSILVFRLPAQDYSLLGLATLLSAGAANGVASSSLALLVLFLLGSIAGVTTPLRLVELARPTHPLLNQLVMKAPGTYNHTLLVSNLAEQAAEAIQGDALLARVGAYYHDIGKTLRPYFFVDNQFDGANVHERLDPQTSAQIIVSHVTDGLELGRRHRLPQRVLDFIPQHHGTMLISYFYHQACEAAGGCENVDASLFRYPGPKPQSKETAVVMLADGCEAVVRSEHPPTVEEVDKLVHKIIMQRLESGQLEECALTMDDLRKIRQAFVGVLQGVYHPRIRYPGLPTEEESSSEVAVSDEETPAPGATEATVDE